MGHPCPLFITLSSSDGSVGRSKGDSTAPRLVLPSNASFEPWQCFTLQRMARSTFAWPERENLTGANISTVSEGLHISFTTPQGVVSNEGIPNVSVVFTADDVPAASRGQPTSDACSGTKEYRVLAHPPPPEPQSFCSCERSCTGMDVRCVVTPELLPRKFTLTASRLRSKAQLEVDICTLPIPSEDQTGSVITAVLSPWLIIILVLGGITLVTGIVYGIHLQYPRKEAIVLPVTQTNEDEENAVTDVGDDYHKALTAVLTLDMPWHEAGDDTTQRKCWHCRTWSCCTRQRA